MKRHCVTGILLAALIFFAGSAQLSAQNPLWPLALISNGETVYDVVNHVTWLTDANLPARERFGVPLCDASFMAPCVNPSGIMDYLSATTWILAMNNANYQGHSNWQLPTTPSTDSSCPGTGTLGNSFGFGCEANAMGYLYYRALGFRAPNTAVPLPPNRVGPFRNFQPDHYWSNSSGGGQQIGQQNPIANFDFVDGSQGGGTAGDFQYVLPMIEGKIPGTPPANGMGLEVNPDGQTVYDPVAKVTWLADANLAASDTFGLPRCQTPTTPVNCVAQDGSMTNGSAGQFIINMNAYDHGAGYLGQTHWQLPPINAGCPTLNCYGMGNPMGILFYTQFGLSAGTPVVQPPDIAVGPFLHLWPSPYWSCQGPTIQGACETVGPSGSSATPAEFGFSFGDGYLGTAHLPAFHFVTAYYVGCGLPGLWCSLLSGF
jgi:hypothetical protein